MTIRILTLTFLSGCCAIAQTQPTGPLSLHNAPLLEVVNMLASQAKINYVIDPRVKMADSISTYGESQSMDAANLLDVILRINGAQLEQDGNVLRIVPLNEVSSRHDEKTLDLVFLKNMPPDEISRLLSQTEGRATLFAYAPAGLLMVLR